MGRPGWVDPFGLFNLDLVYTCKIKNANIHMQYTYIVTWLRQLVLEVDIEVALSSMSSKTRSTAMIPSDDEHNH